VYCGTEARGVGTRRRLGCTLACLLLLAHMASAAASATAPPAPTETCNEPLCYTASSLDAAPNRILLHDIDIVDTTRGLTHIKADMAEATGADLGNSTWVLTGHVQVFMPQGQLSADHATVHFVNKHIISMSAEGSPAQFEHNPGNPTQAAVENARGHAREITYDLEHNELQLNGDSWLTDGCNEINSQHIVYDTLTQRVQAETPPGDGARVHGTIRSRSSSSCGSGGGGGSGSSSSSSSVRP
jgi:lipopolysaccharide transport protein LptA